MNKLKQNGLLCADEDFVWEGTDVVECPNDPEHAVEPVHISDVAMGHEEDEDHFHYGRGDYVYSGDHIVDSL